MRNPSDVRASRREFFRTIAGGGAALALGSSLPLSILSACNSASLLDGTDSVIGGEPHWDSDRYPLRVPPVVTGNGIALAAAPGVADIGGGTTAAALMFNGTLPAPTIALRTGDPIRATMLNGLSQDLIVHWHGLTPPEAADGHPRFAVKPGGTYAYDFPVTNRAGLYWYHPHTHMRTAEQAYKGLAGLIVVRDAEEDALALPSGAREIAVVFQDKRVDANGAPYYEPSGPDLMTGYMGTALFGNGTRDPYVEVETALYRFRVLNGSNARIFRLARGDGQPMVLIGNEGGLLPRTYTVDYVDMAPAERVDLLIDLRASKVGDAVMLRSLAFTIPDATPMEGLQGEPLDMLELRVARAVTDAATVPATLPPPPLPDPALSVRERVFTFTSDGGDHRINGLSFDPARIDETVTFGDTEIWRFVNQSPMPHPVHMHAVHFRVLTREGGRAALFPWEDGLKDTVLLHPFETVRVAMRFDTYKGLFLMHCHNLEHEDIGMMINFAIQ